MSSALIWLSGGAGVLLAGWMAWGWRNLPITSDSGGTPSGDVPVTATARDALRVLAVTLWAALIAGLLVPGLGGRLLMRIMAATSSPETQGRLTEANEVVGEITLGGTIGFILFVGLLGGLIVVPFFPFVRNWLPRAAWRAGLVIAAPLLGIVGVSDPLSPANRDFVVLQPRWLAVLLVILVALLFGVTFAALAARLDAAVPALSLRPRSVLGHGVLVVLAGPPLAVAGVLYVAARVLGRAPQLRGWHVRRRRLAHVVVAAVVAVTALRTVLASAEILSR